MKTLISLVAVFACAGALCHAELRIPSSVFTMEELDEAKAKAYEDKEPLIFVYTDPGST